MDTTKTETTMAPTTNRPAMMTTNGFKAGDRATWTMANGETARVTVLSVPHAAKGREARIQIVVASGPWAGEFRTVTARAEKLSK